MDPRPPFITTTPCAFAARASKWSVLLVVILAVAGCREAPELQAPETSVGTNNGTGNSSNASGGTNNATVANNRGLNTHTNAGTNNGAGSNNNNGTNLNTNSSNNAGPNNTNNACDTTLFEFFDANVWNPFMGSTCFGCHGPDRAGSEGSGLDLIVVSNAGDLATNLEIVRTVAVMEEDGTSILTAKARGDLDHGGGVILQENSTNYQNLVELVRRIEDPSYCGAEADPNNSFDPDNVADVCMVPPVTSRFDDSVPIDTPAIFTHRLTHWQYRAMISMVLRYYEADVGDRLPPDGRAGPIPANQDISPSPGDFELYATAAQELAAIVIERERDDPDSYLVCDGPQDRACAQHLVETLGRRIWRRPLTNDEVEDHLEIFDIGAEADFYEGMRFVLEALLQSPHALYQIEFGVPDTGVGDERRLSGLEIATRLAFFFTNAPPTDDLLDAAIAGALNTDAGVEDWIERFLMEESQTRFGTQQFHQHWLGSRREAYIEKDADLYPDFTFGLYQALKRSQEVWAAYTILEGDGLLETLLSAPETLVRFSNAEADYFGVTENDHPDSPTYANLGSVVSLPEDERAGLLTAPVLMSNAAYSDARHTRPILRGVKILNNVLCADLPPPANHFPLPAREMGQTAAEQIAYTTENAPCVDCHQYINPIGLAFESYDAIGRYRETESGFLLETSGDYGATQLCDEDRVAFDNAVDFVRSLSTNDQVRACYTLQWFRFGMRREPRADGSDAGNLAAIYQRFSDADFNIRELFKAIATSRAFLYRRFEP